MPKNVESSIRIVGSKPGDLDEITENSEQENIVFAVCLTL